MTENQAQKPSRVLFEPWSLGDAVIAGWALRNLVSCSNSKNVVLACSERCSGILRPLFPELQIDSIDISYTSRGKRTPFDGISEILPSEVKADVVYGIRGDFRDYRAAKKRYPNAKIRMVGWGAFVARRMRILDVPFKRGSFPTVSRYERWADLLGFPRPSKVVSTPKHGKRIGLHVGAQWGARRYPYSSELVALLRSRGTNVVLVGGPSDGAERTLRDAELINFLKNEIDFLICNESSPMHIARILDVPTAVIYANTGIDEWLPPGALAISHVPPGGYGPRYPYVSDDPFSGNRPWPSPSEIIEILAYNGWIEKV